MSPTKDDFLDRLRNLDENIQYSYLSRLEKYIITLDDDGSNTSKNSLCIIEEENEDCYVQKKKKPFKQRQVLIT